MPASLLALAYTSATPSDTVINLPPVNAPVGSQVVVVVGGPSNAFVGSGSARLYSDSLGNALGSATVPFAMPPNSFLDYAVFPNITHGGSDTFIVTQDVEPGVVAVPLQIAVLVMGNTDNNASHTGWGTGDARAGPPNNGPTYNYSVTGTLAAPLYTAISVVIGLFPSADNVSQVGLTWPVVGGQTLFLAQTASAGVFSGQLYTMGMGLIYQPGFTVAHPTVTTTVDVTMANATSGKWAYIDQGVVGGPSSGGGTGWKAVNSRSLLPYHALG